jgi:hypothetical protein
MADSHSAGTGSIPVQETIFYLSTQNTKVFMISKIYNDIDQEVVLPNIQSEIIQQLLVVPGSIVSRLSHKVFDSSFDLLDLIKFVGKLLKTKII